MSVWAPGLDDMQRGYIMHIGTQNFAIQNHAAQRPAQEQNRTQNHEQSGSSGRGERLVARHDQNNDGKLSTSELQDTRLGKKISIDRFAQLDKNGDGQLEAGELNRKGKDHGPSTTERALVAKFADLLAAPAKPPEPANLGEDIAKALLTRLDKDDSGGLNSESRNSEPGQRAQPSPLGAIGAIGPGRASGCAPRSEQ